VRCRRPVPVIQDNLMYMGLRAAEAVDDSCTYVCGFCGYARVGTPRIDRRLKLQELCYKCGRKLDNLEQCPACSFPRGWKQVTCPFCNSQQPVFVPNPRCDEYHLQCVACERSVYRICHLGWI
jgi:hypothetical protein